MNETVLPGALDLAQTLDCGQAFRWTELAPGLWEGVAGEHYLQARQLPEGVALRLNGPEDEAFWRRYFDVDGDYPSSLGRLSALHPVLAQAAGLYPGIRLLRQDPWEALCSFLLS